MRRSFAKALSLILVGSLALQITGCSNSGIRNPLKGRPKVTLGPVPEPTSNLAADVMWQDKVTKGGAYFTKIKPEVTEHIVYQASHLGDVVALDKRTGSQLWKVKTNLPIASGPKLFKDTLFVGTKDARVVALNATDGSLLWERTVSSEVLSPPQSNGKVVLANSIDGKLVALNHKTGEQMWTYEKSVPSLTLRGGSSPVFTGSQAIAGFANGKLVALELKNGAMAWERTVSIPRGRSELHRLVDIHATPVVSGDDVYVATYHGNMVSISLKSGQVKWERPVATYRDIALDASNVYLTDKDHQIWAIDRANGTTLWKQAALNKRVITGPAIASDYVVVGDYGGYVHWLDKQTGQHLGSQSIGKKILQTPVSEGSVVYITQDNGKLTALRLPRGDA